ARSRNPPAQTSRQILLLRQLRPPPPTRPPRGLPDRLLLPVPPARLRRLRKAPSRLKALPLRPRRRLTRRRRRSSKSRAYGLKPRLGRFARASCPGRFAL